MDGWVWATIVVAAVAVLAGVVWAIAQNQRYSDLAESNRVQMRLIPPRRGWIVDRHGQPIATAAA